MAKKHILYISYDGFLEPIAYSQVIAYVTALSQEPGICFSLISFEKAQHGINQDSITKLEYALGQHGITWTRLRYHKRWRLVATAWDILQGIWTAVRIHRKTPVHAVHGRSFIATLIGSIVAGWYRLPLIYDVRGFWSEELRVNGRLKQGWLFSCIRSLELRLLRQAAAVVVLTQAAQEHLRKNYPTAVHKPLYAIPCCVHPRFQFSRQGRQNIRQQLKLEHKYVLLYSGSLENWYLLDKMLHCFQAILSVQPNAHFLILASAGQQAVRPLCRQMGIGADSLTLTQVESARMPDYISAADMGLFFIRTPPAARGISPVKFAEYLACHLPVLSNTGIGDLDLIFSQYALGALVDTYADASYVAAFRRIQALQARPDYLLENCQQAVRERFALKVGTQQYRRVYQDLSILQTVHVSPEQRESNLKAVP